MHTNAEAITDQLAEVRARYRALHEKLENYPDYEGDSILEWHAHHDQRKRLDDEFRDLGNQIQMLELQKDKLKNAG